MPQHDAKLRLVLLVAGNAPRTERARANLARAMEHAELPSGGWSEVDLLAEPESAVRHRVFATPALLWVVEPHPAVGPADDPVVAALYGDLSDEAALNRFLAEHQHLINSGSSNGTATP